MLPISQWLNDNLARYIAMMTRRRIEISPRVWDRKREYWAKCVYWGEPEQ
jgi:hypothetical protein